MGTAAAVMAKIAKVIAEIVKKAAQAISKAAGKTTEVTQQAGKAQEALQKTSTSQSAERNSGTAREAAQANRSQTQETPRESRLSGGTLDLDEAKVTEKTAGKNRKDPAKAAREEEKSQEKNQKQIIGNIDKELANINPVKKIGNIEKGPREEAMRE